MKNKIITFIFMTISLTVFADEKAKNNADEISKHYAALPVLYNFDSTVQEKISAKITRNM